MNFTSKGTREILVAGCQGKMFKIDVEKGAIVETVRPPVHDHEEYTDVRSSMPTRNTPS